MAEQKNSMQVNVDFGNYPDLLDGLDEIVSDDMSDRSKVIRKLVAQEIARRQNPPMKKRETNPRMRAVAA